MKIMGPAFTKAVYILEFHRKIEEIKKEVASFFEEKGGIGNDVNFGEIEAKLDKMKLETGKMEALKQLEKEILNEKRLNKENNSNGIGVGKKLKLVERLVKLHEKVNGFIDGLKAELQIRMPLEYAKKLEKLIQREKEKMNSEFLVILDEEKSLNRIREIIGKKKRELAEKAANPKPAFSAKVSYYENRKLPDKYEENKKMLSAAYSPHNLLLEKVKLKVPESVEFVPDGIQEIQAHFERMAELVNEAVDEMPRLVVEDPFFKREEQKYSNLRRNLYNFEYLISASNHLFNLAFPIAQGKLDKVEQINAMIYIHLLAKFIRQELEALNVEYFSQNENLYNLNELPEEIKIRDEKMDRKAKIYLIAENMLFICAQLEKVQMNEKELWETGLGSTKEGAERYSNARKIIEQGMAPEHIGQYFYRIFVNSFRGMQHEDAIGFGQKNEKKVETKRDEGITKQTEIERGNEHFKNIDSPRRAKMQPMRNIEKELNNAGMESFKGKSIGSSSFKGINLIEENAKKNEQFGGSNSAGEDEQIVWKSADEQDDDSNQSKHLNNGEGKMHSKIQEMEGNEDELSSSKDEKNQNERIERLGQSSDYESANESSSPKHLEYGKKVTDVEIESSNLADEAGEEKIEEAEQQKTDEEPKFTKS